MDIVELINRTTRICLEQTTFLSNVRKELELVKKLESFKKTFNEMKKITNERF